MISSRYCTYPELIYHETTLWIINQSLPKKTRCCPESPLVTMATKIHHFNIPFQWSPVTSHGVPDAIWFAMVPSCSIRSFSPWPPRCVRSTASPRPVVRSPCPLIGAWRARWIDCRRRDRGRSWRRSPGHFFWVYFLDEHTDIYICNIYVIDV